MLTPQQYLERLAAQSRTHHEAWWLRSEKTGTPESRRAKLRATLSFHGQEHRAQSLEALLEADPLTSDLSPELRDVVEQTAKDLQEYVLPGEMATFQQMVFGLLPLAGVDAFCVDRTHDGDRLDGHLVVLNEGLFVCAQLLSKAFLLDNVEGDLEDYKRPGVDAYRNAIEHFLAPSGKHANEVFFKDVPPEVEGLLSAAQMRMTILLLQFVMLHEVGHAVHGDHALMSEYRFHIAGAEQPPKATEKHWAAEYAADLYALERILGHTGTNAGRWANFVAICSFFQWLAAVEKRIGSPLCPLHPPPLQRAAALRTLLVGIVPLDDETGAQVEKSYEIFSSWGRQA